MGALASGNYQAGTLTTFNIDNDALMELPTVYGPADLPTANEYTQAQTFKVIITHEGTHGLGADHTMDSTDLMYANTTGLDRDGNLSADAKRDLDIFNGRTP